MITIKDLRKKYENIEVLKGLNLKVKSKEILVILGQSGVGKSVLLRHIIGIEKPDSGFVEVNGVNITALKQNLIYQAVKNMGMLFQGAALFDSMNIGDNTGFSLKRRKDPKTNKRYSKEFVKERVHEALKMVGLENAEKKMPSDLSGGMKKRAALARMIAYRPSILLYDEPTTGLDPITAQQINELIVKTQNELFGTSIIVTHDLNSALYVADRIALHNNGIITHIDTPDNFMKIDDPIIHFLKQTLTSHPHARKEKKDV